MNKGPYRLSFLQTSKLTVFSFSPSQYCLSVKPHLYCRRGDERPNVKASSVFIGKATGTFGISK